MRWIETTVFTFVLMVLISSTCHSENLNVGSIAPNWVLADAQGEPVSLYQESEAGNTTVMVFFASWCGNCKDLMPALNHFHNAASDKAIAFYLLNVWEDPDPETLKKAQTTAIPVLMRADNVARRFEVGTTPGVVVVGPDKRILYKRTSGTSVEETQKALSELLNLPAL